MDYPFDMDRVNQLIKLEKIDQAIEIVFLEGKKAGIKACSSLVENLVNCDDFLTQPTYLCPPDTDVSILRFSARIYTVFSRHNVKTVGDLLKHSKKEILTCFHGIGAGSLDEITNKLGQLGYKLREY